MSSTSCSTALAPRRPTQAVAIDEVIVGGSLGLWLWHSGPGGVTVPGPWVEDVDVLGDGFLTVDGATGTLSAATVAGFSGVTTVEDGLMSVAVSPDGTTVALSGHAGNITFATLTPDRS